MTRVLITRQDGTRRVVEVSRTGKVKSDQPACETCQGSGVAPEASRLARLTAAQLLADEHPAVFRQHALDLANLVLGGGAR